MNQSLIVWALILIYLTCSISDTEFFLYLNIYSVINFLHIYLIIVGLKFHLVLATSAHYCCSITHLLIFFHQLIITLNLCFLKIFFHKQRQRFLTLRRIIGLVLTFFMEVKKYMTSSNLMSKVYKVGYCFKPIWSYYPFCWGFCQNFLSSFLFGLIRFFVSSWANCKRYF